MRPNLIWSGSGAESDRESDDIFATERVMMRELACFALREPDDTACNFLAGSQPQTALPTLDLRMLVDIVVIFSFVEA